MEQLVNHIKKHVNFDGMDEEHLLTLGEVMTVSNRTFLLKKRQICRANYFIVSGCFRSFLIDKNGTEKIVHFGIENWWVTDYDSFINQIPSNLTIQAIENAIVYKISKNNWDKLIHLSPNFERYFRIILQYIFIASQRRIEYMFNLSGEELYHLFVSTNPEFTQRVPQYMLASYLGFTPEFLSKVRSKKRSRSLS